MPPFCDNVLLKINLKLPFCISCVRSDMIEGCGCVLQMVCLRCGREDGDEDPQVKHVNRSILSTSAFNIHTIYHTAFVLSYCQHQHLMPYMTKRIQFDIKANARQCGLESCLSCKTNIHTYAGRNILRQHLFPIITRLITI